MNRTFFSLLFALLLLGSTAGTAFAQANKPLAPKLKNLGDHHRLIKTGSPEAQRFFDQGLVLAFAFNHAEGARAFREAQRLDPACAMCAWGEALILGPHVNATMNAEDVPAAWAALQRARTLAAAETPVNRALIEALTARYVAEPVEDRSDLDKAYADAMRHVAARFPDDPDVQSLFAEALMDTMPWDYWHEDGSPKPATEEVLATLERAQASNPDHPMALHLWIHAVEKQRPELGVEAAERLGPLVPAAGHLVHMPGHIWIRVGRYHDAVLANQQAVLADDDYLAQCHAQGLYPMGYVPHNHHFLWVSAALGGEKKTALASAAHMGHHADMMGEPGMSFLQHFSMSLLYAQAFFGEWDAILATPAPPDSLIYPTGVWHFARGLAFARTGQPDKAQHALNALRPLAADTSLGEQFGGLNTLSSILQIAEPYLAGEMAGVRGDYDAAIAALEEAVRLEDDLIYDEPPPWALPSRWALGRILLDAGHPAESEAIYRADLAIYPENGRGLFGLQQALHAQGRDAEANALQPRINAAWQYADVPLAEAVGTAPAAPTLRFGNLQLPNGVQLHYAEQGDPSGQPVLFLHGYSDSWFSFSPVLSLLPSTIHGFALDQRGHGDSDRPVDGYAMRDFAADAIAFMDAMGLDRATVVGHSMGSFIAQQVALSAPERVERLLLIGAGPSVHAVEGLSELEQAVETLGDPVPEAFVREFQASTFHQPVPSAYMDRVVAESRKVPGHVWRKTLAGMLGSSLPAHLPIGVPTLIVWGEEDLYFRRASQETLLALLPQATLEVYPETGHATHWERPEWFARDLAAFIARTTPQ